jgi:lipoate-protein ligase A
MWRLIVNEGTAAENMAIDESILNLKGEEKSPNTLRLYVFSPSAITIGYSQRINEVIDREFADKQRIPIVRRITGGGAVYHDQKGEITYSIVASIDCMPSDIQETFAKICSGIVFALEEFELQARFEPINDVVVNGRKISGSAQIRKKNAILQHGTVLYNTDIVTLGKLLRVPKEKLMKHGVDTIFDRVTTISREINRKVTKEEVIDALIKGFGRAFNVEFWKSPLEKIEINLAQEALEKYKNEKWNYNDYHANT